ncbi:MAG TPA: alpha-amylase family glycosyl hydrolase, partial [Pirellulaceae bacterium]
MTEHPHYPPSLGARYLGNGCCQFRVWAPHATTVDLKLVSPSSRIQRMSVVRDGYYELVAEGVRPGDLYFYRLGNRVDRPDPASRFQPLGVHEPSAVVDPLFAWTDGDWRGIPLSRHVIYELHVGTYTPEGTFAGIIPRLGKLRELGITALELMPVAQFPGTRNWGYDGVHPFAPQSSYGGPAGLKHLVDACHSYGIAVVLDVVYNHVGPEGNYLRDFGPYFTDAYRNPWGDAINMDGPHSDEVRRYFIENALYWLDEFHLDALRLDAVDSIHDTAAQPFLRELADAVRLEGERQNRRLHTIAESAWNDPFVLQRKELGGCGLDAQWCDDLHHSVRTMLTDARGAYFQDFRGWEDLVTTYRLGFALAGRHSIYRGRRHGAPLLDLDPGRLVVYSQNHDQVANGSQGRRNAELLD